MTAQLEPAIRVHDLTKNYGSVTAVDRLSFDVARGEVFGLLGPNGAGKTTTVRMLCRLIAPTNGDGSILGYDLRSSSNSRDIRKRIGLVPDNVGLYEELSAYENLDYFGKLHECPVQVRKKRIEYYLDRFDLFEKRHVAVGEFSKGMKQKLSLARAMIHDPELLFLDEPTANLDPESARAVTTLIRELKDRGKTVFLNTHNLGEAERLCDRVGILSTKLMVLDTPEALRRSVWGSKTIVELDQISRDMTGMLERAYSGKVSFDGNTATFEVEDPERENPDIVSTIVAAGGRVRFVTKLNPAFEDTYMKIVGRSL